MSGKIHQEGEASVLKNVNSKDDPETPELDTVQSDKKEVALLNYQEDSKNANVDKQDNSVHNPIDGGNSPKKEPSESEKDLKSEEKPS